MNAVPTMRWRRRADALAQLTARDTPVILKGALAAWTMISSPLPQLCAALARRAGHRVVMTSRAADEEGGLLSYQRGAAHGQSWSDEQLTFAAFLEAAQACARRPRAGVRYLQSAVLERELPELLELFPDPFFAPSRRELLRQASPRLWLGSGGHRVGLHYDIDHNFHCVVAGGKRFTLYPPAAIPHVYLGAPDRSPAGAPTALVDPLHPDLARFPRFAQVAAQAQVAELSPGDVLFLPAYWLHHVESVGVNAAVTYWWSDLPAEARTRADAALTHSLLELRSLPAPWRERYAILFDTFVWHRHGDPLAHVPMAEQGLFGTATSARERELRVQLRRLLLASHALELPLDPELPHRLAAELTFHVVGAQQLEAHVPGREPVPISLELFELLREFHQPRVLGSLASARYRGDAPAQDRFLALCQALVRRGVLSPVPLTREPAPASDERSRATATPRPRVRRQRAPRPRR